MQARSKEPVCKFCSLVRDYGYTETVKQIPRSVCPQEFLLTQIHGYDGKLLKEDDEVCTNHESQFENIYISYSRGGAVSKQHKDEYKKIKTSVEANCVYCAKTCLVFRKISSFNDDFVKFLTNEGT